MAKPFTTVTLVRGKEPMLRQVACEVRYRDGQLYLDRCGRLLKQLLHNAPEWVVAPDPTFQGTTVYHLPTGAQLAFSMASAALVLKLVVRPIDPLKPEVVCQIDDAIWPAFGPQPESPTGDDGSGTDEAVTD